MVGVHKASVSRARRDPQHPAYQRPDGTFTDARTIITSGRSGMEVRAPRDAIAAFWAARRAPKTKTTGEETTDA